MKPESDTEKHPRFLFPRRTNAATEFAVLQKPNILLILEGKKRLGGRGQNKKQNALEMKQN